MFFVILQLFIFFFCLFCSAIIAFLETSFTALRVYKIEQLKEVLPGYKKFFDLWKNSPEKILVSILIIANFFGILGSVIISRVMEDTFGPLGLVFGVSIATFLGLLVGDIVPKTLAKVSGEKYFSYFIWLLNLTTVLFSGFAEFLLNLSSTLLKPLGMKLNSSQAEAHVGEKEIEFLIGYGKGKVIDEKTKMLQSIFQISSMPVNKIMVPRAQMETLSADSSLEDAINFFSRTNLSRVPIFDKTLDKIAGILLFKDVAKNFYEQSKVKVISEIMNDVIFIPENKSVSSVLKDFLNEKTHMFLVTGEYGVILGLVTLEDVMEQIVGEISDEFDLGEEEVIALKDGGFRVSGDLDLEELKNICGLEIKSNAKTVGGFIIEAAGKVPEKGFVLNFENFKFRVAGISFSSIQTVDISKNKK